jgi:predicted AlkP superfamily phosphohydrolase/phosphomutase
MKEIKRDLIFGLASWMVVGLLYSWWLISYTSFYRHFTDSLLLSLYLIIIFLVYGIFAAILFYALAGLIKIIRIKIPFPNPGWLISVSGFFYLCYLFVLSSFKVVNAATLKGLILTLLCLIISSSVTLIVYRKFKAFGIFSGRNIIFFIAVTAFLILIIPGILNIALNSKPVIDIADIEIKPSGLKAALIGLDAACWDVADPLIDEGELPTFSFLKQRGCSGILISRLSGFVTVSKTAPMGILSPSIWETIATGFPDTEHGIFDFTSIRFPVMKNGVSLIGHGVPSSRIVLLFDPEQPLTTSTEHRMIRLWDIFDRKGYSSLIVAWLTSWPMTPMQNGFMVSDRFHLNAGRDIWPPSLSGNIEPFEKPSLGILHDYYGCFPSLFGSRSIDDLIKRDPFFSRFPITTETIYYALANDLYHIKLSNVLYNRIKPDFFAVYLRELDHVEHKTWKYYEPQYFDNVDPKAIKRFGCVIPDHYKLYDKTLKEYIDRFDSTTITIIVSDHGQAPRGSFNKDAAKQFISGFEDQDISGYHQIQGIIAMYGPHIKKGYRITNASVFDIAPTILYIYGFPVARDMPGRPLLEAFEEDFVRTHPVTYIDSYGASYPERTDSTTSSVDYKIKNRLKALGYIE